MIKLRNYQQPFYQDIINKLYLEDVKKLLAVLPTGGGKSVIIGNPDATLAEYKAKRG